jgi:hypothetical protein
MYNAHWATLRKSMHNTIYSAVSAPETYLLREKEREVLNMDTLKEFKKDFNIHSCFNNIPSIANTELLI